MKFALAVGLCCAVFLAVATAQVGISAHPQPRTRREPKQLTWWKFSLCNLSPAAVRIETEQIDAVAAGRLNLAAVEATPRVMELERGGSFWGTTLRLCGAGGLATGTAQATGRVIIGGAIGKAIPIVGGACIVGDMVRKSREKLPDYYAAPGDLLRGMTLAPAGQAGQCGSGFRLAQRTEPERSFDAVWEPSVNAGLRAPGAGLRENPMPETRSPMPD